MNSFHIKQKEIKIYHTLNKKYIFEMNRKIQHSNSPKPFNSINAKQSILRNAIELIHSVSYWINTVFFDSFCLFFFDSINSLVKVNN